MGLSELEKRPAEGCGRRIRYSVYGVTLESEISLSLPASADAVSPPIQLYIGKNEKFAPVRPHLPDLRPGECQRQAVLGDGSVYIRWEDWLELIVTADGRRVTVGRLRGVPVESFEAYISNFAVCAALIQQGEEPLHATVVGIGKEAVGLLGQSGAGKSTLAAYLFGRGARLVTDDMLRITIHDGVAIAQPGPARLKLLRDAAERYLKNGCYRGRWDSYAQKCIYEPDGHAEENHKPSPLSALYWLDLPEEGRQEENVTIKQLTGLELFQVISASTMNSGLFTAGRLERQFSFATRIGQLLPVYRISYPRRHDVFDDVLAAIKQTIR